MNRFLAFVKKEFLHILRDRRTLLILFGLPFLQVVLFGFALNNEIKNAEVGLFDADHGVHSQQIVTKLVSSEYFQLRATLRSYRDMETAFRQNKIKLAVVIPANFTDDYTHGRAAQIQLISDATEQNTAISLTNYATAIIAAYGAEQQAGTSPETTPPMQIDVSTRMVFNPELKGAFVFVPGVMAMVLLLVSAMMTSVTIAREKETGTMDVLLVSPLNQGQILFGKIVPYLLLSFLNGCLIIVLGVFLLHIPLHGSLPLLLAETLLFIFLALSIGLLISSVTDSQLVAMFASLVVMLMPTIFLSGFIFPIESMPRPLQLISTIIPAKYFIDIVKGVMIKGVGLAILWPQTLVLVGMALFFIGLSLRNLKTRLG